MTDKPTKQSQPEPAPEQTQTEQENLQGVPEEPQAALENPPAEKPAHLETTAKPAPEKSSVEKKSSAAKKAAAAAPAPKTVEKPAPRKKATLGAVLSALGLMLLEILLPVILSSVLLWWIFATFNLWSYNRTLALVVFAVGMVAFSLLLSIMFDSATARARKHQRAAGVRFSSAALTRLIKLVTGGVILPLALYASASLVPLPAGLPVRGTAMNYIIASSAQPVKLTPPDEVGSLALETKDPTTKVLSIQVLKGFKSAQALGQLIRMASEDKTALSDPSVAGALSSAIAAYGKDARDPLIVLFRSVDPNKVGAAANDDAYTRYFTASFDQMKAEVKASALTQDEKEARLAQIDAAAAQLKTALKDLPAGKVSGDPRPNFALNTLLAMDITTDPDLLSFARSTAADQNYPASIRGSALLLIGKLGTKEDLDMLYPYLKNSSPVIQTHALQAIGNLQAKISGTPTK